MNDNQSRQRPKFPLLVRRGSAVVRIYWTPNRGRETYTLSYWVAGERKRQSFAKLDEAKNEAERIATSLTNGDLDVAKINSADWACYSRAKQLSDSVNIPLEEVAAQFVTAKKVLGAIPLGQAVEYYLKKHPRDLAQRSVKDIIAEMLESKRGDGLSPKYLEHLKYDLNKFSKAFNCNIGSVNGIEIDSWLRSLGVAPRTRNNLRTSVQTLFSFAKAKRYLPKDHDELDGVSLAKDSNGVIEIFTPVEMESILACADERVVPFLVLGAFAGIRHAEIQRLNWDDIRFEDNLIEIRAAKAKTASRRIIPVLPNLRKWLMSHRKSSGPICAFKNMSDEIVDLEKKVNAKWKDQNIGRIFSWKRNGLRHSFISYRVAQIQNVQQVALEAGNSPQIIFSHYRELVRPSDSQKWFSIIPKHGQANKSENRVRPPHIAAIAFNRSRWN